jgi:hypothetical protein
MINLPQFLILLLVCLLVGACATSKKRKQEQADAALVLAEESSVPLAPGSARITATIVSLEAAPRGYHCVLDVQGVQGYGSSVPPLPEGSQILVLVGMQLLETTAPGKRAAEILPVGETLDFTLSFQRSPALQSGAQTPSWRILSIR